MAVYNLDADVAYLYGVETREVNQAVKNNPEKFPAHYMFELTPSELRDLKSKVLISNVSNNSRRGATKAFTERGLYMLATVLKGERARLVTFTIIETFFKVRELKRELLDLHKETDMAEMTKDTPKYIWPITVTTDRYGGGYSKGKFLAFNLLPWQVPEEIDGDDITCMDFWTGEGRKAYTIGKGFTACEAIEDLESQLRELDNRG